MTKSTTHLRSSKVCPHCQRDLPLDGFHKDRSRASGRTSWCRDCSNARDRAKAGQLKPARSRSCESCGLPTPTFKHRYCAAHANARAKVCAACGIAFDGSRDDPARHRPTCSYICRAFLQYGRWPSSDLIKKQRPLKLPRCKGCGSRGERRASGYCRLRCEVTHRPQPRRKTRHFTAGYCQRCGEAWVDWTRPHCQPRCCGTRCGAREAKAQRQRKLRGGTPVYRQRIYERDGWRCQLCGKQIKRNAKAPHPLSPSLDHIVPVSLGGKHEPTNVQAAHFLCNALKSNTGTGDQLRLVG